MTEFYRVVESVDVPNVDSIESFLVSFEDAEEAVGEVLGELDLRMHQIGFDHPLCYAIGTEGDVRLVLAYWIDVEREVTARTLIRADSQVQDDAIETTTVEFVSSFPDGSYLLSTASNTHLSPPEGCEVNQFIGASEEALLDTHRRRARSSRREILRLTTDDDVLNSVESYHELWRDHLISNGIFQELVDGEPEPTVPGNSEDHAVLEEMRRQAENKRGPWLLMLVVTGALFLGLGGAVWDFKFVLMLIPILLLHEAGHFVAMKFFGYRNVQMFFIPLFGAAVSGRRFNIAGWKEVVVSLAGPVPGIVLAGIMLVIAQFYPNDLLPMIAIQLAVINGINLLPILPLDGGWVAQTLLFSRHPWLSGGFKLLAALALIGTAIVDQSIVIGFLGASMLFAMPVSMKVERVSRELRKEGLHITTDSDTISDETGLRIVQELRAKLGAPTTTQNLATFSLNAFEQLHASPPGVLATFLLGAIHVISFIAAFVIAGLAMFGGLGAKFAELEQLQEVHQGDVTSEQIQRWPEAADLETPRELLVASFEDAVSAEAEFQRLKTEPVELLLVGRTLITAISTTDEALFETLTAELEGSAVHVFRQRFPPGFTLTAEAPDEETAEQVAKTVNDFFRLPASDLLIPPWSPTHQIGQQDATRRDQIREYQQLSWDVWEEPRVVKLKESHQEDPKLDGLTPEEQVPIRIQQNEETAALVQQIVKERKSQFRKAITDEEFLAVIDAFDEWQELYNQEEEPDQETEEAVLRRIADGLGAVPQDEDGSFAATRFSAGMGAGDHQGRTITIEAGDATRADHLLPVLAEYLAKQGCTLKAYTIDVQVPDDFWDDELEGW